LLQPPVQLDEDEAAVVVAVVVNRNDEIIFLDGFIFCKPPPISHLLLPAVMTNIQNGTNNKNQMKSYLVALWSYHQLIKHLKLDEERSQDICCVLKLLTLKLHADGVFGTQRPTSHSTLIITVLVVRLLPVKLSVLSRITQILLKMNGCIRKLLY
jgi:hypothetical protein